MICSRLSGHLHGFLSGRMDEATLVGKLRALARAIEGDELSRCDAAEPIDDSREKRVFAHWQSRMGKPNAKFTTGRREKIRARLRDGYTVEQLERAVDACAASDFHMGQNDSGTAYNDLTQILRNGEKLEQFLEQRNDQDPTHHEDPETIRLQREASDAMKRGDTNAYNAANSRLRSHNDDRQLR